MCVCSDVCDNLFFVDWCLERGELVGCRGMSGSVVGVGWSLCFVVFVIGVIVIVLRFVWWRFVLFLFGFMMLCIGVCL